MQSTRTGSRIWTTLAGKLFSINEKQGRYTHEGQKKFCQLCKKRNVKIYVMLV